MTELSDLELVGRFSSDDPEERERAFAEVFRRHQRRAFELAFRVLGDRALASDAVQEAFLAVYRKGARFEARSKFSSWLYRVVVNQCIDLRRREKRHRARSLSGALGTRSGEDEAVLPEIAADGDTRPEPRAILGERAELVRHAITQLSPKLAEVVVLRYPQGRSYEEIGEILELPPGTVRSRLNRAHAALRKLLADTLDPEGTADPG